MNCKECKSQRQDESFAASVLRAYKRTAYIAIAVLSAIIVALIAYICYDAYIDSQYGCCDIEAEQDGYGTNIISGGDMEYGAKS